MAAETSRNKRTITWIKKNVTLRNVILFVTPVSIAVLIIMLYNLSTTVDHLSQSLIKRTTTRTYRELSTFFDPVKKNLFVAREQGRANLFSCLDPEILNPRFIPLLKNFPQVSSMMIADTCGNEYMLLQEDSTWSNRHTIRDRTGNRCIRTRWKCTSENKLILLNKWNEEKEYDPRSRPWYLEAIQNKQENEPAWTKPYTFFTTKDPGITISVKWTSQDKNKQYVIAFDILLLDISRFTSGLDISPNGKAFVITDDEKLLGLPSDKRFTATDSLKKYVLQDAAAITIPSVKDAITEWNMLKRDVEHPYVFESGDADWWCGFTPFRLSSKETFYIGVVVPEDDFLAEVNRTRTVIIGGFLLVIALTLLVIRGYNQKRKAYAILEQKNVQIAQQKDMIEEQQKEIKDSIRYSQRIQTAILPPDNLIQSLLPDSFILYMPRDIVSGDFYWIQQTGNIILFCAADCTGHGVPGAFMSIVGHNGLNRAVKEFGLRHPRDILNKLNEIVAETLRQDGSVQAEEDKESTTLKLKDGMDIALCAYYPEENTLEFAGAYNPLYLVRKKGGSLIVNDNAEEPVIEENGNVLFEVKATKMPIGSYDYEKEFDNYRIKLSPGDTIYLFSDGFADQFGGPKGKKYRYKPFKRILMEISDQPMAEQKEILKKSFTEWKGQIAQIDDVIVFGVRF